MTMVQGTEPSFFVMRCLFWIKLMAWINAIFMVIATISLCKCVKRKEWFDYFL